MRKLSLRFRINLVITLVVVVFTLATTNLLLEETRRSIREEMEAGTRITAQLLENEDSACAFFMFEAALAFHARRHIVRWRSRAAAPSARLPQPC